MHGRFRNLQKQTLGDGCIGWIFLFFFYFGASRSGEGVDGDGDGDGEFSHEMSPFPRVLLSLGVYLFIVSLSSLYRLSIVYLSSIYSSIVHLSTDCKYQVQRRSDSGFGFCSGDLEGGLGLFGVVWFGLMRGGLMG